ncbi:response regulator transcription factor [Treponema phagedenis]|uniref:response regulator transcription factor n=1 Tax=Treponema phagedenis TaxID=162 RepID=UPI000464947D|nr:response regulator transcription factor [Treponema phagedenis]NVP22861.1 response regulator transcription factor [Treponema phagedenis]QKS92215.1 response regulator transcription factor [Treponema phagedenis]QLC57760.1 response regulator transcription factor [Treponema phagedenis]QSH93904.1 DNA-binding response regulator [Treponema phagedenis]
MNERILIIEDDPDIRELLAYSLSKDGYQTHAAGTAEDGFTILRKESIHLVLLDLMLPVMDGYGFLKRIKNSAEYKNIPVIIVSARGDETDIVKGLELGAEDYVSKPFSLRVLTARILAVLRRTATNTKKTEPDSFTVDNLSFNLLRHEVWLDDSIIDLTITEFSILKYLASSPGRVFTRAQIIASIHGEDSPITDRAIDVQILSIRKKLGSKNQKIETVRGVGYRYADSEER